MWYIYILWDSRCFQSLREIIKGSHSLVSDSLRPHGLYPTGLLHPWSFLGKSTGVGCHFLLHGIFPTHGSNQGLPHFGQTLYHLSHQGIPIYIYYGTLIVQSLSHVPLFATLWTLPLQAPLSMEFSRQEHSSGLPFPFQGIFLT